MNIINTNSFLNTYHITKASTLDKPFLVKFGRQVIKRCDTCKEAAKTLKTLRG